MIVTNLCASIGASYIFSSIRSCGQLAYAVDTWTNDWKFVKLFYNIIIILMDYIYRHLFVHICIFYDLPLNMIFPCKDLSFLWDYEH